MSNSRTSTQTRKLLGKIEMDFARRLRDRLGEVGRAFASWQASPDLASGQKLYRLVHQLAGSAASFGFTDVGNKARALDERLRGLIGDPAAIDAGDWISLSAAVGALCEDPGTSGEPTGHQGPEPVARLIYLIEDDDQLAQIIALHLVDRGYTVEVLPTPGKLAEAVALVEPSLVIIDMFGDRQEGGSPAVVARINAEREVPLPAIFLSVRNDLATRLAVLRSGASVFLNKPIDFGQLMRQVDLLAAAEDAAPLRALVVDDDNVSLTLFSETLRRANFEVVTEQTPEGALERATHFRPEVMLLDLWLPGCQGLELAGILRQDAALRDVPVVLVTADPTDETERACHEMGAAYLTKPVDGGALVRRLTQQAREHRMREALRDRRPWKAASRSVQRVGRLSTVIEVRRLSGSNELDEEGTGRLRRAVEGQLNAGRSTIIVDLGGVEHVDAGGLGYLVRLSNDLPPRGARLLLCGLDAGLESFLERLGFDRALSMTDRSEALREAGLDPASPDALLPSESGVHVALADEELARAQRLQRSMLPEVPVIDGVAFDVRYRPCSLLSGDFYDFVPLGPRKLAVVVGDVTGHGVTAALVMGVCKKVIKLFGTVLGSPREVLVHANSELVGELDGRTFISLVYGVLDLDARTFEFARAGHEPVLVCRGSEPPWRVQPSGAALGLALGAKFESQLQVETIQLAPGDLCLMYTDGLIEAATPDGAQIGPDGVDEVIAGLPRPLIPTALLDALERKVYVHRGPNPPEDDLTLLSFRVD